MLNEVAPWVVEGAETRVIVPDTIPAEFHTPRDWLELLRSLNGKRGVITKLGMYEELVKEHPVDKQLHTGVMVDGKSYLVPLAWMVPFGVKLPEKGDRVVVLQGDARDSDICFWSNVEDAYVGREGVVIGHKIDHRHLIVEFDDGKTRCFDARWLRLTNEILGPKSQDPVTLTVKNEFQSVKLLKVRLKTLLGSFESMEAKNRELGLTINKLNDRLAEKRENHKLAIGDLERKIARYEDLVSCIKDSEPDLLVSCISDYESLCGDYESLILEMYYGSLDAEEDLVHNRQWTADQSAKISGLCVLVEKLRLKNTLMFGILIIALGMTCVTFFVYTAKATKTWY